MYNLDVPRQPASRVRMVFKDRVLSYDLSTQATMGDIARTLNDLSYRHYHRPVSINLIIGRRRKFWAP
jgi:hypothetical protein